MKKCPACRREYFDDTLNFCLDDGSWLLEGAIDNEPATAIVSEKQSSATGLSPSESKTEILRLAGEAGDELQGSIAILPFVNISADPENEFFCDGLAEELLNALSKIDNLKVAARTSAFSFKGKNVDISQIGNALGVKTILEGSVRKSGNRLRVSVQLANAADGYHLWSEQYDREMRDIFEVQDEITLSVVSALKLQLFPDKRSKILKKGTADAEAYELYLQGRFFWNKRTPADFTKAIEYFEKAIAIDPGYALAYSGLADSYAFLGYSEVFSPAEIAPKTRAAAFRALELDETLAESHASVAMFRSFYEFDQGGAEESLLKAIDLNPNSPAAHYWYCSLLASQGRFDESERQGRISLELDPLSPIVSGNAARCLCHARKYDEAISLANKSLAISPNFFFTHWVLGVAYEQTGKLNDAVENFRKAASTSGILPMKADLGVALAKAGHVDEAREMLDSFIEQSKHRYVSPVCISKIYIALGEIGPALEWLEKAREDRSVGLMWLRTEPIFDTIRSEPFFQNLSKSIGLPTSENPKVSKVPE